VAIASRVKGKFGGGCGMCSCVKVSETIKLPFEVVSAVDQEVGVLDGVHIPQGEGGLGVFIVHCLNGVFE